MYITSEYNLTKVYVGHFLERMYTIVLVLTSHEKQCFGTTENNIRFSLLSNKTYRRLKQTPRKNDFKSTRQLMSSDTRTHAVHGDTHRDDIGQSELVPNGVQQLAPQWASGTKHTFRDTTAERRSSSLLYT